MSGLQNTKSLIQLIKTDDKKFWVGVFLYRLLLTIFVAKHHSLFADEYNQLTEIVYHMLYGGTQLSFEWEVPLRSITHPLIYSLLTFLAKCLGLDYPIVVQYNVYLIHILISMIGDYFFIQFGKVFFGEKYIKTAMILRFSNFLYMEYSIRPFSNVIEEIFFLIGIIFFNKIYKEKSNDNKHLFFAFIVPISFIFRNTSSILWFSPLVWILFKKFHLVKYFILSTMITFFVQMLIDYTFYKRLTLPFLNFIIFNASESQFWTEGPFFYLTICLPGFLLLVLPFSLRGCYQHSVEILKQNNLPWLLIICVSYVTVLSFVGHKEIRFIYPIISSLIYFGSYSMKKMMKKNRSRFLYKILLANAIFNLFCLILISNYIKVYSPIIKAVKGIPEIKKLQIFSWYDFPVYSEFHNSNIEIDYQHCSKIYKIFEQNYQGIVNREEEPGKSLKDQQILDNWIQSAINQGPEKLPEWILAPQFIGDCSSNQIALETFYYRYQEIFYELDLMQLRNQNWEKININYIIYKRKNH